MAKGYQQHKERQDAVLALGKDLVRRSGSKCELCGAAGEKLSAFEVEPVPHAPDAEHCAFLCDECRQGAEGGKLNQERWRFLESAIWNEIPAVQVVAVRTCRRLEDEGVRWASDTLSNLYLDPEVEKWVGS